MNDGSEVMDYNDGMQTYVAGANSQNTIMSQQQTGTIRQNPRKNKTIKDRKHQQNTIRSVIHDGDEMEEGEEVDIGTCRTILVENFNAEVQKNAMGQEEEPDFMKYIKN